jgi:hypothetical protein
MQLADHVERKCNGQSAAAKATAHPVVCGRHPAWHCCLVSTSHVSLCASPHRHFPDPQQPFQ